MTFSLRDIIREDINLLAEVYAEAFKPERTGEHWTLENSKALMEYCFDRSSKDLRILVVNEKGKIIGAFFADVKPWWDGSRIVNAEFFIEPDYQKLGAGRMLFKEILQRAKANHNAINFETITFMPDTEHPLKWYLKLGFQKETDWVIINGNIDLILNELQD